MSIHRLLTAVANKKGGGLGAISAVNGKFKAV